MRRKEHVSPKKATHSQSTSRKNPDWMLKRIQEGSRKPKLTIRSLKSRIDGITPAISRHSVDQIREIFTKAYPELG